MPSRSIGPGVGGLNYSVLLREPVAMSDAKGRGTLAAVAVAGAAAERAKVLGSGVAGLARSVIEALQRMQMAAAEREIARVRQMMNLDAKHPTHSRYY